MRRVLTFDRRYLGLLLLVFVACRGARAESVSGLKPQGYVSDFAHVLAPQTVEQLSRLCAEVEQKAHAQIAVVTVHSLDGEPIEQFSIQLAMKWGVGTKGTDRGVLILLAPAERRYRIEVGYGLEPVLTDALTGRFGREAVPDLRAGDYNTALLRLTSNVAGAIAQASGVNLANRPTLPRGQRRQRQNDISGYAPLIIFLILLGVGGFGAFGSRFGGPGGFRRRGGWWLGGPWMGGGFGGFGGGGGGGGFGGFGGGSFGGGGASGSW